MEVINGQLRGRQVLRNDVAFRGLLDGDLVVPGPHRLELDGLVTGDLIVEAGAAAVVRGTVSGTVFNNGGEVEIFGTVGSVAGTTPCRVDASAVVYK